MGIKNIVWFDIFSSRRILSKSRKILIFEYPAALMRLGDMAQRLPQEMQLQSLQKLKKEEKKKKKKYRKILFWLDDEEFLAILNAPGFGHNAWATATRSPEQVIVTVQAIMS